MNQIYEEIQFLRRFQDVDESVKLDQYYFLIFITRKLELLDEQVDIYDIRMKRRKIARIYTILSEATQWIARGQIEKSAIKISGEGEGGGRRVRV